VPERAHATILLVDDNEANRFVVARILQEAGYRTLEAESGAAMRPHLPEADLVVLDVHLPDTSGFEIVDRLKRDPATASLPVLMISASFTTDEAKAHGLDAGADGYLTHPVVPMVLLATVRSLLRGRAAERALRTVAEERARLYAAEREAREGAEEARRSAEEATARAALLQQVTNALSRTMTTEEVGRETLAQVVGTLGMTGGAVAALRGDGLTMEIVAHLNRPAELMEAWRVFPLDAPIPLAVAARTGEVIFDETREAIERDFPTSRAAGTAAGSGAVAALPLRAGERTLGAIALVHDAPHHFDDGDRALLVALAGQCAQAMDRARLHEAERQARAAAERAARVNATLAAVSDVLASSLDLEPTLARLGELVAHALAEYIQIYLVEGDELRRVATTCTSPALAPLIRRLGERAPLRLDGASPQARVIRTGEPVLIPEVDDAFLDRAADDAEHAALLREIGPRSLIIVPLAARGRNLGIIACARVVAGRPFTAADLDVATELARRAALAVDNARLYADAQEARRRSEEARERADEANRAKSDFLATMSHELRTPLNAIGGYAQILAMGVRGPVTPEQVEDLTRIQRSQQHLLGLINDVLNFAKLEAGRVEYAITDVPVAELLDGLLPLIEPQVLGKGLVLRRIPCAPELAARADPEKMRQVVLNLLSNAVKFTPGGGRITISCEQEESSVVIRVLDTGIGIPADKIASIFEPFVQVDRRLQRETDGIGLGLSISRNLARAMGGDLTAASTPGEGAVFTLRLPRAASRAHPPSGGSGAGALAASGPRP
jgi:signal transduction histidine kinase/DNA-binding response OmpR family regulator